MNEKRLQRIFQKSTQNSGCIGTQEGYTIEYKQNFGWGSMPEYVRAMAAMANNKGGHIIFGIKDKPHVMTGLNDKSLKKFEERDLSVWSNFVREHFEPAIEFERDIYEFEGNKYGIIEVHEATTKPVICKKYVEEKLKIGAIYYRYKAENTEIQYAELRSILDEETKKINSLWMDKIRQISMAGVSNTMILNTSSGKLYGEKNSLYISSELLNQIRFVDKGKFVETDGEPVLSIVGEVKKTQETPISVTIGEKEVALSNNRIIECFLFQEKVSNSAEYMKFILNSQAKNLPVFYYLKNLPRDYIEHVVGYSGSKEHVETRIKESLYQEKLRDTGTIAYRKKIKMQEALLAQDNSVLAVAEDDLKYLFCAIRTVDARIIIQNKDYFMLLLRNIYEDKYQNMKQNTSAEFKKAICYVDEVLNKQNYSAKI
ncbi:ATP-binding protein [Cellulosilyticum ruminicola]|uniref:ATP-binding protein n=1 Tax=Cellulosilyticum ruminicola TaxID=425254 RepID=UPI0006D10553|nr:ATP-binding protein [Cellulosilyticum ruminicola]